MALFRGILPGEEKAEGKNENASRSIRSSGRPRWTGCNGEPLPRRVESKCRGNREKGCAPRPACNARKVKFTVDWQRDKDFAQQLCPLFLASREMDRYKIHIDSRRFPRSVLSVSFPFLPFLLFFSLFFARVFPYPLWTHEGARFRDIDLVATWTLGERTRCYGFQ